MKPITINGFLGANLALDAKLLPEGVGVSASNIEPGFGDMRPMRGLGSSLASVTSNHKTIYRMGSGYWFSWLNRVNATVGFDADDTTERIYITGNGVPAWTNNVIGLTGGPPYPQAVRLLAVPAPITAANATIAVDGTGTEVARAYRYTWVNDIGWESAPSPASNIVMVKPGGTVNLIGFDTPPGGNYGITTVRLYELVTGTSGAAEWFLLRSWAIGATPNNPIDDARAVGSAALVTETWRVPPTDGHGLKKLWNGMLGMLAGNALRICEPYAPYAWPLDYEIALGAKGVAIGVVGQRMLVLTEGDARIVAGSSPLMDDAPAGINKPCVSATSVVEFNEGAAVKGVVWASTRGLCWWGDGTGYVALTEDRLLTPTQWSAMTPATMVGLRRKSYYVGFYYDGAAWKAFMVNTADPSGIYYLSAGYEAVYRDPVTDRIYVNDAGQVKEWDVGSALTAEFKSKVVELPAPMSFGAVEVVANGWPATVQLWLDGEDWHTQTITAGEVVRPPGGRKASDVQVRVSSAQRVLAVRLARAVEDLKEP